MRCFVREGAAISNENGDIAEKIPGLQAALDSLMEAIQVFVRFSPASLIQVRH